MTVTPRFERDPLGGLTVLRAEALTEVGVRQYVENVVSKSVPLAELRSWDGILYRPLAARPLPQPASGTVQLDLIPYYACDASQPGMPGITRNSPNAARTRPTQGAPLAVGDSRGLKSRSVSSVPGVSVAAVNGAHFAPAGQRLTIRSGFVKSAPGTGPQMGGVRTSHARPPLDLETGLR